MFESLIFTDCRPVPCCIVGLIRVQVQSGAIVVGASTPIARIVRKANLHVSATASSTIRAAIPRSALLRLMTPHATSPAPAPASDAAAAAARMPATFLAAPSTPTPRVLVELGLGWA
mmetsp:Transcript_51136/g.148462  ORF Transcript_51136/g.148462 Transcript_51136/m.148462 type:complete len:117 (-) Transcript_51136:193-543(-)